MGISSSHIFGFMTITGISLFLNFYFSLIPVNWIIGIFMVVGLLGALFVGKDLLDYDLGTDNSLVNQLDGAPGTGSHYDTAIEPDEAWRFVNERINELEHTPFRKIDTDTTNLKKNQKSEQDTIRATIDGRETRITMIMGRPVNGRSGELIAYIVDLAKPSIHNWSGGLTTDDEKANPFNGKYGFHISEGGNSISDSSKKDSNAFVEINEGAKKGSEEVKE